MDPPRKTGGSHFLGCFLVPTAAVITIMGGIWWYRAANPPDPRVGQVVAIAQKRSECGANPSGSCGGATIYTSRDVHRAVAAACTTPDRIATADDPCTRARARAMSEGGFTPVPPGTRLRVKRADGDEVEVEVVMPNGRGGRSGWMSSGRLYHPGD